MANRELRPWTGGALTPFGRDPFSSFRREVDRLFDDFFTPAEPRSFAGQAGTLPLFPSLDVEETAQAYLVTAELPGLEAKDVEIDLRDDALTISGEKREERKAEERGRTYAERTFGRFQRTIPLPIEVDADKAEAAFANGVLKITLPKSPEARETARRIQIKGGDGAAAGKA